MPNVVISIFTLENDRGLFVPKVDIKYIEQDTGIQWFINCGGTRAYFIRIGSKLGSNFDLECADSHFMANRVVTSLFIAGLGLFKASAVGRVLLEDIISEELKFHSHLDIRNIEDAKQSGQIEQLADWYKFICSNGLFRRAADDAYFAMLNPVESVFHVYRGMEWLLRAGNIGWDKLAEDIGVTFKEIKEFKRMANFDLGQRHGVGTARKLRVEPAEYGSLVAYFVYGMCKVRGRVDKDYEVPTPDHCAKVVMKALPLVPYP